MSGRLEMQNFNGTLSNVCCIVVVYFSCLVTE
jgi:hypothetical protein